MHRIPATISTGCKRAQTGSEVAGTQSAGKGGRGRYLPALRVLPGQAHLLLPDQLVLVVAVARSVEGAGGAGHRRLEAGVLGDDVVGQDAAVCAGNARGVSTPLLATYSRQLQVSATYSRFCARQRQEAGSEEGRTAPAADDQALRIGQPCRQRYRWHLEKNATQMPAILWRLTRR